jgi:NADH:ubiquinone reductase (H+-translocating)
MIKKKSKKVEQIRVDFSLRREVFFVVVGAIVGAVTFVIPKTIFEVEMGLPYYLSWIVFGHVIGVYSSASVFAGIGIHMLTAISIGVVVGIFLYKSGILNISKPSNGLIYGLFSGSIVFAVFFIPVQQFVLGPQMVSTLPEMDPSITQAEVTDMIKINLSAIMAQSLVTHLVFGVSLGFVSSLLSIKFGSRYRCSDCDISFSRIDSYRKHRELVHGKKPIQLKRIVILGGGFAGIEVLRRLQKAFQDDISIDLRLVSRDNFLLFSPMLPEVSSGLIETRHIVTPIRSFCNRARFYEANVESIDLKDMHVTISHKVGRETGPIDTRTHILKYDFLVIAIGGETNFFGMADLSEHAFTIKTLGDAIILRNHVINMLEQADVEDEDENLKTRLLTFVVVGGGFSGVETVGELNDFIQDSIKHYYHNIKREDARIVLVNSGTRVLPEVTEDLSEFALQKLRKNGTEVILNSRVTGATMNSVKLSDGSEIPTHTLVWAGGVRPGSLVANLVCEHDKVGRVISNNNLEIQGISTTNVYALGDCASITDPNTGKPCPPTAQHAIRQAKVAAENIISAVRSPSISVQQGNDSNKKIFNYKTKGIMALIGKRNGVGILFDHKVQGFLAWWLWRLYYLGNLPTTEKKLRVIVDWSIDLLFKRDVTRLKTIPSDAEKKTETENNREKLKTAQKEKKKQEEKITD